MHAVLKSNAGAPEWTNASTRKAAFRISDESEDRDGDVISLGGWQLDSYRSNPVVLWSHDTKALPVGRSVEIGVSKSALRSVVEFPPEGAYPFADTVRALVLGGFLKGASVGFHPLEAKPRGRSKGTHFTRQELYEFSILPIPSNRSALVDAEQKGLDVRPLLEGATALLDRRLVSDDDETGELIVKAIRIYRPTVHLGRGATDEQKSRSREIHSEFQSLIAGNIQDSLRAGRTPAEAERLAMESGHELLAGVLAHRRVDAAASAVVIPANPATGERAVTALDVSQSIAHAIQSDLRERRDFARDERHRTHKLGEADADEIARVQGAGTLKR
jgi:HK97 family phage prohead protease